MFFSESAKLYFRKFYFFNASAIQAVGTYHTVMNSLVPPPPGSPIMAALVGSVVRRSCVSCLQQAAINDLELLPRLEDV